MDILEVIKELRQELERIGRHGVTGEVVLQAKQGIEAELQESTRDMPVDFLDGVLLATPDQAVESLMEYVDAGAQGINVALRPPVDEEALAAYLESVVPAVRREVG